MGNSFKTKTMTKTVRQYSNIWNIPERAGIFCSEPGGCEPVSVEAV